MNQMAYGGLQLIVLSVFAAWLWQGWHVATACAASCGLFLVAVGALRQKIK